MAIKGLTDQAAAFPRIGELRKGEKKPESGNRPGKDLTYFRFTTEDALALKMFTEAYPDQSALRNINVFLPHKTTDENIDSWIEKWVAGGLVYRSDGETMVLWRTDKGGYSTEPKPDFNQELDGSGKRKDGSGQVGRLSVIIPELGRFATVTVLTTSKHDIINLTRQLRSYEALRGDLRGIPFIIKRRPYKISTPGQGGKRERREKWLLSIETQPAWTMAQLGAMEQAALPAGDIVEMDAPDYHLAELPSGISDPFDSEPEDEAPIAEPPTSGNGHKEKLARPMTPEQVKKAMQVKAARNSAPPSDQQLDYAMSSLSKACGSNDPKRHSVMLYLFGKDSGKGLTGGECSALIDWVGAKAENEYTPDENTLREIEAIIAEYMREQGQIDMFANEDEVPF